MSESASRDVPRACENACDDCPFVYAVELDAKSRGYGDEFPDFHHESSPKPAARDMRYAAQLLDRGDLSSVSELQLGETCDGPSYSWNGETAKCSSDYLRESTAARADLKDMAKSWSESLRVKAVEADTQSIEDSLLGTDRALQGMKAAALRVGSRVLETISN